MYKDLEDNNSIKDVIKYIAIGMEGIHANCKKKNRILLYKLIDLI